MNWLKELKTGDEVMVRNKWLSNFTIEKVSHITESGLIRLENDMLCSHISGAVRGKLNTFIEPVTDELKEAQARLRAVTCLKEFNYDLLSNEAILSLLSIIEKEIKQ